MRKFITMEMLPWNPPSIKEKMESGNAVQECINAFSEAPTQFLKAEATVNIGNPLRPRGSVHITFDRTNLSDFPKITCDSDVMKSFGIPHGSFDPNFESNKFSFEKKEMKLRITGKNYDFTLSEIRLVSEK